ncbi:LysR substrate-binding domain-containing protein [Pseudomonas citrulli]|uniref:LysR substrate-binding domain-containing protein n=1 Tax=Pseudomonas citrulli TaxID=3064347 RepID=A0ABT9BY08_9PSED|nr:LysR substrate-binding domain-containing protein [Pseudomonas sp. K18]MDO7897439.1 LysR substrate-binding domain-containing protein [Pseudomonas sp. K18]
MELAQLTMFKVVAEQGSIVQASKLLHCVPSNITNRIKLLERELGVPLFIRKGRGLVISPSGTLLLGYANRILSLCQEARRALDPEAAPAGPLRIGAIESSATGRLPALLSRYHHEYPTVDLQFSTGTWSQLVAKVADHQLDGAIIAVDSNHPDLEHLALYEEALVLIASPTVGKITQPQDLAGKPLFMWPDGCPYRQALEQWLNKHQVPFNITSIASYGTILGCVSAGAGVSLVPAGVFEQFKHMGNINGFSLNPLKPVQNYFVWNKHTGAHRAKDAFVWLLEGEFKGFGSVLGNAAGYEI